MANSILLRNVPDDVLKLILKVQHEEKNSRLIKQYSLESAVYKLIREKKEEKVS